MKFELSLVLCAVFLASTQLLTAGDASIKYEEGISFEVKTVPIEHQGPNVVDLKVHFGYQPNLKEKDYPDFEPLQAMAAKFLQEYPNNGDYWEIVIKKLSAIYLEKAPGLANVAIELQVYPTKTVSYYHVIHCTASRSQ